MTDKKQDSQIKKGGTQIVTPVDKLPNNLPQSIVGDPNGTKSEPKPRR